jgi:glycosyltransferase involved in cell wall biosynthesis
MNILLLCYQGDVAGSTYSMQALANALAEKGHNVYMGCRKASLLFRLLSHTKVKLLPMPFRGKADLHTVHLIRKAIKRHQIDVVNPQASQDRYLTAMAVMFMHRKPVVVHTRRQRPRSDGGKLQSWFYERTTDRIVAVSQSVKNQLVAKGINAEHIEVIYNGTPKEKYKLLDHEKTEQLRKKYNLQPNDLVIGCIARPKRQQQLMKALAFIDFPLKVVFVGMERTNMMAELEKNILAIHQIYYTGIIPPEEALNYYPLFTINILPSISEGLSQALLEAMAIGIPVIATAASGNLDLVRDGENGLLYQNENSQELADKIKLLIQDQGLRKRLTEAGKKTALEDFSLEKTVSRYESFFTELIEKKKSVY